MNIDNVGISELKWTGMGDIIQKNIILLLWARILWKKNVVALIVNKRV